MRNRFKKNIRRFVYCFGVVFITVNCAASYADSSLSPAAQQYIQSYLFQHPDWKHNQIKIEKTALQKIKAMQINKIKIMELRPKNVTLPSLYPVRSDLLSAGKVHFRKNKLTLPLPIALIGDDAMSESWLAYYYQRLLQLHVKVYVVNVQNENDMLKLQKKFPDLQLVPVRADIIAKQLELKHYPVLISSHYIEQ